MATIEEICTIFLDDPNSVFYILNHREKQVFRSRLLLRHYRKNEYIFQAGDIPTGLICLAEGKVKVFQEGSGGREQIIRMARPIALSDTEPCLQKRYMLHQP